MQALKASGSSQYDKFFQSNPTLDPTSSQYQPKPSNAQKSQTRYANSQAKYAARSAKYSLSKAAATAHIGTKGATKSVTIPGVKHVSLRTAMRSPVRSTKLVTPKIAAGPKISLTKAPRTLGRSVHLCCNSGGYSRRSVTSQRSIRPTDRDGRR